MDAVNNLSLLLKRIPNISNRHIVLLYDTESELATLMTESYKKALSKYDFEAVDFYSKTEDEIYALFDALASESLVILVESKSFRVTKYRLRVDLNHKGHSVIEHARLSFMLSDEFQTYIDSLSDDTEYYIQTADHLSSCFARSSSFKVVSDAGELMLDGEVEEKIVRNCGEFSEDKPISAGFPIGEIFTEAKDLSKLNGSVSVFGFPGLDHKTNIVDPFSITIKDGLVVGHNGPREFDQMYELIKTEDDEGRVFVREIGLGLNRAMSPKRTLKEPTAFERFCGLHFSLGKKHGIFKKKFHKKTLQRFHVDVFCLPTQIFIGDTRVYDKGEYVGST